MKDGDMIVRKWQALRWYLRGTMLLSLTQIDRYWEIYIELRRN